MCDQNENGREAISGSRLGRIEVCVNVGQTIMAIRLTLVNVIAAGIP